MNLRAHGLPILSAGCLLLLATTAGGQSLRDIRVRGAGDGSRIVLDVQGDVEARSFTLTKPDRLVVDLVGAQDAVRVKTRSVPGGPVARVRIAQFAKDPKPIARVVADLRQKVAYDVRREGDVWVVQVVPKGQAVPEPVPAAAAPPPVQRVAPVAEDVAPAVDDVGRIMRDLDPGAAPPAAQPAVTAAEASIAPTSEAEKTVRDTKRTAPAPKAKSGSPSPVTAKQVDVAPPAAAVPAVEPVPVDKPTVAPPVAPPVRRAVTPRAQPAPAAKPVVRQPARVPAESQPTSAASHREWRSRSVREDTAPDPTLHFDATDGRRINLDVQGADIRTVLRTLSEYSGKNIIASREVQGEVSATLKDTPWRSALDALLKAHGFGYVEENGIIRVGNLQRIRNEELEEAAAARKRDELLPIETRVVRMEFADAEGLRKSLSEMLTQRGRLQVDKRTNSLIISDIPQSTAMIADMARELDGRTPQVEITSKLIDVAADESENLGITWSANNVMAGEVLGSAGVTSPTAGAVGGIRVGTVQSWGQLDMMLDALAKKRKANIVSNPNITTVDNREAKILVGAKIPLIVADEAGNAITQLTTIGIQMRVTPHVNSDKTITLDLHPEVSELSSQATVQGGVIINTSEADTRVIVEDGETAIIGGLIRNVTSETRTGIPVLQDIPGVGWLFRNTNKTNDKRELIIFVTPHMIEPEVSLGGDRGR